MPVLVYIHDSVVVAWQKVQECNADLQHNMLACMKALRRPDLLFLFVETDSTESVGQLTTTALRMQTAAWA